MARDNGHEEQDVRSREVLDRKFPYPEISTQLVTEKADNGNSVVSWHVFDRQYLYFNMYFVQDFCLHVYRMLRCIVTFPYNHINLYVIFYRGLDV